MSDREELLQLVNTLAVKRESVVLSGGDRADFYIDLRRITLHHRAAPLVGRVMNQLVADWEHSAVGGLTLGADPVATAMMHHSGRPVDAFTVRKTEKVHGLQRRIEGPSVEGRRVVALEDTSTTGSSVLKAVDAIHTAGAVVAGVAVVVDRGARAAVEAAGLEYRAAFELAELSL